ncbi:U3 small nucleolar RNA associated protein 6 [Trichuris trichiura]|uniref:U3 small nucleolar RNA associated protein 6 n=1 Tax=Trichuris trichiura TaxID=36087 RepID=A0A077YZR4_TRITR|nr:U3 small nucleolar RNA associated protein 6 [Trichuris trichiura]
MSVPVERHLECLLAIFESLERLKLFTREEFRLTVAKLKSHEYRTQRICKRKQDLLAYIQKDVKSADLKLPAIVFRHAVKAIEDDRSFCCRLLEVVHSFPFAKQLADQVEQYMNDHFANDEKQIDHIIRSDSCFFKKFDLQVFDEGIMDESLWVERFRACCQKYTNAIENSPSYGMHLLYINFCHDVFRLPSSSSPLREQSYLRLFFGYAMTYVTCQCDAGFFVDWANICPTAHCKVIILQAGLRRFPKAIDLWLLLLKYQSDAQMDENVIDASISKAKQLLSPDEAFPIWKKAIGRYSSNSCPTKLLEQFKSGIHLQASISNYVKREYLRFIYNTKGIESARKLYHQKLCVVSPASLQLHYDYVSFEMEQKPPCAEYIRKSYEKAIVHHGCNVKIWLDYLLFESTIGNAFLCSQIHHRAVRNLPPELVQQFLEANVLRESVPTKRSHKSCH